jgi:membrane-associated phospholipid phosphatase
MASKLELAATAAVIIYASLAATVFPALTPPTRFLERDFALSAPYVQATCPTWLLVALAVAIPGALFVCVEGVAAWRARSPLRDVAARVGHGAQLLVNAILLTMAVTDTIKCATAYPRPNFFAYCDYAGYRHAISAGNLTAYLAATTAGALGDPARCLSPTAVVRDAQLSFPSGHASVSFASMSVAAYYARRALGVAPGAVVSPSALLAASPLAVAAWVTLSRVRDRFHGTADVLCGAVIGAVIGALAWRQYVAGCEARGEGCEVVRGGEGGRQSVVVYGSGAALTRVDGGPGAAAGPKV